MYPLDQPESGWALNPFSQMGISQGADISGCAETWISFKFSADLFRVLANVSKSSNEGKLADGCLISRTYKVTASKVSVDVKSAFL